MHAITAKNLFRRRNPGAIHQPLQTAKNAARRLDGMACAVLVGHIGFDKTCAGAQLGSQRLASVPVHIRQHNPASRLDNHARRTRTQPGGTAGYDKN